MRAAVIYESMYGNTREVAEAIAEGLQSHYDTTVSRAADADEHLLGSVSLLVAGGPTHAMTMSRPITRDAAVEQAPKQHIPHVERAAAGPGLREWLGRTDRVPAQVATFATRVDAPRWFTGNAAKPLARELRRRGGWLVEPPMTFLVTKRAPHLLAGELDRARAWGAHLAVRAVSAHGATT